MKRATKRTRVFLFFVFFYENMHEPEVNSCMKDMYEQVRRLGCGIGGDG